MLYYTQPTPSRFYHDLRNAQDDRTVLTNPHKGWYFHYIDNGMRAPKYRNTLKPGDDLKAYPGLNHMYLRFDWSDIEEEEGVYHWEKLDDILETWGKHGYRFSMRMCTFEANRPMIPYATPKYVFDAGAAGTQFTCMEPDYGDPIYLEKLERFMAAYGEHYNGHPLLDFIDVGTFGTWGEGHTTSGSCRSYSLEVLKRHIDLHLKNFPDTYVLVNDDMINHMAATNPQDAAYLLEYCAGKGMGMRDDSLYVHGYCVNYGCDMLQNPTGFDWLWRSGPVDLESAHQSMQRADDMDGGFRFLEAMRRTHATYAGFHGDIYAWYENNKAFHDFCANRLGYWYFLEGYELPDLCCGTDAVLTLHISNRGFAPAYHLYETRIIARDQDGHEFRLNRESPDNRRWMNGETVQERIRLRTRDLPAGAYTLHLGLFDQERPVLFAMRSDFRDKQGYHCLGEMRIRE